MSEIFQRDATHDESRRDFEFWLSSEEDFNDYSVDADTGYYQDWQIQRAWFAWQAARKVTVSETAMPETPGSWEQRCAHLYQVIGCLADMAGVFTTSDDVADALDVAAGRGDVEGLLPWPKDIAMYQTVLKRNAEPQAPVSASSGAGAMKPVDEPAASAPVSATRSLKTASLADLEKANELPNDKHDDKIRGVLEKLRRAMSDMPRQSYRMDIDDACFRLEQMLQETPSATRANEWIACRDRRPGPYITVLLDCGGVKSTGFWNGAAWAVDVNTEADPHVVPTHWMPIPQRDEYVHGESK